MATALLAFASGACWLETISRSTESLLVPGWAAHLINKDTLHREGDYHGDGIHANINAYPPSSEWCKDGHSVIACTSWFNRR